jgi:hypothetical protein
MQIRVTGGPELRQLAANLRRASHNVRRELADSLKEPTEAVKRDIKHGIETASLAGRRTGHLPRFRGVIPSKGVRTPTSRAVEAKVSTSAANPRAEVTLNASHVPERIRALVPYWGGTKKRLRHPIMGRKSRWAGQHLPDVWTGALKPHIKQYRDEASRALGRIRDMIEGK